jgi:hypothetical protein
LAPARAEARVVKRLDYESGGLGQWAYVQALPGRISVVKSPRHQGKFAARFVVKSGDRPVAGSGERSEVYTLTGEHAGIDSWWRWDTYFPRAFHPVKGDWNVFTQWHHTGLSCSPPLHFDVNAWSRPWRIQMVVRGGRLKPNCSVSSEKTFRVAHLRREHWYSFKLHVRWSPYPSRGLVKLWVNRRLRANKHLATLYKGQGVYVKQGFYRAPSSRTSVIYHDGLQRFRP